jgi:hypothetical protein
VIPKPVFDRFAAADITFTDANTPSSVCAIGGCLWLILGG